MELSAERSRGSGPRQTTTQRPQVTATSEQLLPFPSHSHSYFKLFPPNSPPNRRPRSFADLLATIFLACDSRLPTTSHVAVALRSFVLGQLARGAHMSRGRAPVSGTRPGFRSKRSPRCWLVNWWWRLLLSKIIVLSLAFLPDPLKP